MDQGSSFLDQCQPWGLCCSFSGIYCNSCSARAIPGSFRVLTLSLPPAASSLFIHQLWVPHARDSLLHTPNFTPRISGRKGTCSRDFLLQVWHAGRGGDTCGRSVPAILAASPEVRAGTRAALSPTSISQAQSARTLSCSTSPKLSLMCFI